MQILYTKKSLLIVIALLFLSIKGVGQIIQPTTNDTMETINASGEDASGESGSVTYSIGQVFYTYIGESDYNMAQGVQQEEIGRTSLAEEDALEIKTDIVVFPNPTTDFIKVAVDGYETLKGQQFYDVYDLQGRILRNGALTQKETQIDLYDLPAAIYLVKISNNNKILKTFKIVKN